MALDRQNIEKRDFPIGRRGYEPEAVDAHLAALADEIEASGRRRRPTESLAQAASEQVRLIVEAAERSAADIEGAAEDEAAEIRAEANRDAQRAREEAAAQAREQVGRISQAATGLTQRVDAMEGELGTLIETLRTSANRLGADLSLLEGSVGELYGAAGVERGGASTAPPPPTARPEPAGAWTPEPEPVPEDEQPEPPVRLVPAPEAAEAAAPEAEPAAAPAGNGDVEGARLIALNMALNGQSREETDRYLAANFDLPDRERLLDEVYSSVEG